MSKLRDRFWIWGHEAGCHDTSWGFEKSSRMTPTEGACYFGVNKITMVCYGNCPQPSFDREAMAMDSMEEVIWSIVGDAGCDPSPETFGHLNEILRLAEKYPNITGAIFDDFFRPERLEMFTPDKLREIRQKLQEKNLDMWVVFYDRMLDEPPMEYLSEFDGITLWTWRGDDLAKFEENIIKAKAIAQGKRLLLGCYMYNYGDKCELLAKDIEFQLNRYAELVRDGTAEGVILLSNVIGDLGFEAVEYAKAWLQKHGDEPI